MIDRISGKQTLTRFDAASLGHGLAHRMVRADDVMLHCVVGGSGYPLVLLSGWPQSWYAWRKLLPALARRHTVAAIDLPGLGDSDKPASGYDTATVARRVRAGIRTLGFERIVLVTHDIVWHFGFNQQPGLGETLTAGRERVFLDWFFKNRSRVAGAIGERDIDEYERVYSAAGAMRAGFQFYRSMADSARQNKAFAGRAKLEMPVMVLGSDSDLGQTMVEAIAKLGRDVVGEIFTGCGHYIPEEMPDRVLERILPFLE